MRSARFARRVRCRHPRCAPAPAHAPAARRHEQGPREAGLAI
ncbi:hypothetical protein BPC006_I0285 [Burkholderia pseudomallei BPC006]|nr:hypothetical protein BPC006_I0285 [Burkholderia pseudomallei BPC006]